jgi:tRNA-splicing endonuclease subunit Sen2
MANGNAAKRESRPKRPNYKHIHRFPLPLTVHPLPLLIPHNPLSVISIALSYLTYLIRPPQHEVFSAYFDPSTSSVHVTDPRTIRALWEMGFFGRGSLSRSEPTWLEREKKRRGLVDVETSEEVTGMRRVERREWKLERARKEREAIAERLKAESQSLENGDAAQEATGNGTILEPDVKSPDEISTANHDSTPNLLSKEAGVNVNSTASVEKTVRFSQEVETSIADSATATAADSSALKNEEHLQLSNEEAFFLAYGLGALQIYDDQGKSAIPTSSLFPLFRRHSYFPPRDSSSTLEPDDPFMLSYVAYHHFRSLGWVIRSGIKFGVDYMLYNRGPAFTHAEFAVVILPSYQHPYWSQTDERKNRVSKKLNRTWWWLHGVNRVQAHVKKSLVLCYVEIPPPPSTGNGATSAQPEDMDIGAVLGGYKVRELMIRRWVPNRSRD